MTIIKGGQLKYDEKYVQARAGSAILFPQSAHPEPLQHSGVAVTEGTKYILRTDIFYRL